MKECTSNKPKVVSSTKFFFFFKYLSKMKKKKIKMHIPRKKIIALNILNIIGDVHRID